MARSPSLSPTAIAATGLGAVALAVAVSVSWVGGSGLVGARSFCRAAGRRIECNGTIDAVNRPTRIRIGARDRTRARDYRVRLRLDVETGRVRAQFKTPSGAVVTAIATPDRPAILSGRVRFRDDRMRLSLDPQGAVTGLRYRAELRR